MHVFITHALLAHRIVASKFVYSVQVFVHGMQLYMYDAIHFLCTIYSSSCNQYSPILVDNLLSVVYYT